jgi:hypothetical protein
VNIPLKIGEGEYLVPFFEYRNVHLVIRDDQRFEEFNTDRYESFELSLGYTFKMKKNWRFGSRLGVLAASNFDEGKANDDDYFLSASVYFIKNEKKRTEGKPWQLVIGVAYNTTAGRPFPLPYINYYRELTQNLSYTVGVPKMNLRYRFNDKHSVQLYARLDGFFANIQNDVTEFSEGNLTVAENVSMTTAMFGPGYAYNFTKNLSVYVYAGYTFINEIRLRDDNFEDVKVINSSNTFYSRAGIKFKI